ncbi:hypothetical protein AB0I98_27745 [Streptomyces sp. NPDC050211]
MGRRIAVLIAAAAAVIAVAGAVHHDGNGHHPLAEDKGPTIIVR